MRPFEFIILFLSFIYTLALTHLLFAATRMIRHRRRLTFSWPHAMWMCSVLILLCGNWIALWDFHSMDAMPLPVILGGFVMSVNQYFICALVSPDFEDGEGYDMRAFNSDQGRTYLGAILCLLGVALVTNFLAGSGLGVQNWANQNGLVIAMFAPVLLSFFVRAAWAQFFGAAAFMALSSSFLLLYYPILR